MKLVAGGDVSKVPQIYPNKKILRKSQVSGYHNLEHQYTSSTGLDANTTGTPG